MRALLRPKRPSQTATWEEVTLKERRHGKMVLLTTDRGRTFMAEHHRLYSPSPGSRPLTSDELRALPWVDPKYARPDPLAERQASFLPQPEPVQP